jgi:uncharacterized protein (DUF983 family)
MPPLRSEQKSRHAETPLQMPTARQALRSLGRAFRLRCPHCGGGWVLTPWGRVRKRCTACGFRFERTDDSYFSGAMFFGLLMGEGLFAVALLLVVVANWPDVPWDALTYGAPLGMLLILPLLLPFSKVVWLAIDVLVRPVLPEEQY